MEKTITGIEIQKHNPNRLNVYLDDEFAFGVSRFVGAWLESGKKLSQDQVKRLVSQDACEKALQKALRFINYRRRTVHEVQEKLEDQGFSGAVIDDVLSELCEKRYLDDLQFAIDWVDSRSHSKPRGRKMLAYELRKKHVAQESIDQALENAPTDTELAHRLGEKYLRRFKHLDKKTFTKKMKGIFARRAFPFSVINQEIEALIKIKNK